MRSSALSTPTFFADKKSYVHFRGLDPAPPPALRGRVAIRNGSRVHAKHWGPRVIGQQWGRDIVFLAASPSTLITRSCTGGRGRNSIRNEAADPRERDTCSPP